MIGKIIRVNDYKFTYGQKTVYINVFGAYKDIKSGIKYVIYSYDNKKLFYGSFFIRDKSGTVMLSKNMDTGIIKTFVENILSGKKNNNIQIINLDNIDNIQIIEEKECDFSIDINKLDELTIAKVKNDNIKEIPKKKFSFGTLGIILLFVVISLFFFINPEVITGKNKLYVCSKTYSHESLPANINEDREIVFTSKGNIVSMDITYNYIFTDHAYYNEFKDKNYFYKYIDEADTYKFDDSLYTYKVFSKVDVKNDFFLPDNENDLITYYTDIGYKCNIKEE